MAGICLLISLIWAIRTRTGVFNGYTFAVGQGQALNTIDFILGITIYLSVYADEFSSNSMQCLIGHGISRFKLILAKMTDCVIITVITYGLLTVFLMIISVIFGAHMNGAEMAYVYGTILANAFRSLGFATVAMIVLYWRRNVVLATLVDVVLITSANMFNFDKIPKLKLMHLENRLYAGAINCANVSLQLGDGLQIITMLWLFIKLAAVSLALSYLLFRKKELEF